MTRLSMILILNVGLLFALSTFAGNRPLPAGMNLVSVPGGTHLVASSRNSSTSRANRQVKVAGFSMSETEVTWGQYCEFLNSRKPAETTCHKWIRLSGESQEGQGRKSSGVRQGRFRERGKRSGRQGRIKDRMNRSEKVSSSHIYRVNGVYKVDQGWADHPVVNVSLAGAKAFCDYYGLRLPTETEWDYAAGGPKRTKYPWGDQFDASKFCHKDNRGSGNPKTMPVKSFTRNGFGLYDMAGNVSEWCSGGRGVLRGSSWMDIGAAAINGARPLNYATSSTQSMGGDMDAFWSPAGNGGFRPVRGG